MKKKTQQSKLTKLHKKMQAMWHKKWLLRGVACLTIAGLLLGTPGPEVQAMSWGRSAESSEEQDLQEEAFREAVLEISEQAGEELPAITEEQPVMALVYLAEYYDVKSAPGTESDTVVTVPGGQTVEIKDMELVFTEAGLEAWAYVSLYHENREYTGYVSRANLACADERFLDWEQEYGMNPDMWVTTYAMNDVVVNSTVANNGATDGASSVSGGDAGVTYSADVAQFPESYRAQLQALKNAHPNWIFVAMNTGLEWDDVIANEIGGGKSLVHKSFGDYAKEGAYDDGSWFYASEAILEYYMDPRNALTEENIFQFEQLVYNASIHKREALKQFLNNTFMNDSQNAPGTHMSFETILWAVGKEQRVSPYHLAARIYQEHGNASSPLISGTVSGYEGYYNYFNIGATGNSNQQYIQNGLSYAKQKEWKDAYSSIRGGTIILAANYIQKGQDTLYLQKFNVTTNNTYGHQYMQNISAPTSEGKSMQKTYTSAGALDSPFVFKIPVYKNMPETACAKPTSSTNVVVQIPAGYSTTVFLDGVEYQPVKRNGRYIVTAPNTGVKTATVYQYNEKGVPTSMYVWTLDYRNNAYQVTAQPQMENLLSYHGFSIRITGKSGIRFKTGIAEEVKGQLLGDGINGYQLKEYGTLVMSNANRGAYPMIKGGEKVLSGVSYGVDTNGQFVDKVYETVNGRNRFTSVLVGLPATQYKTEFAFRGYAVLEKDGAQTVVYGPVVAKSIYNLAEVLLASGTYEEGSSVDVFLKKLISDAQ